MKKPKAPVAPFRVGTGFDVHRFRMDRPLILGGVKISDTGGLDGHSDADVVIHAICDALFGAAGLPDIGVHFPDTDERYRGIHSTELLKNTCEILEERGWHLGNIDAVIIAEKPKLAPYAEQMREIISEILGASPSQVNIKATTSEKLGFTGREEGIAALATALLVAGRADEPREFTEMPV
ncbi:MAG TPA: 2-C-methyl-D-erythritol 2,4-cyclodiphosphate synthase [candidate division Zixibacteria bacterium]|nr:2-C-methyl-D-erythritol 2,4-cyclodiphosphate synthase [candidate division Zixibacteria bacterium]